MIVHVQNNISPTSVQKVPSFRKGWSPGFEEEDPPLPKHVFNNFWKYNTGRTYFQIPRDFLLTPCIFIPEDALGTGQTQITTKYDKSSPSEETPSSFPLREHQRFWGGPGSPKPGQAPSIKNCQKQLVFVGGRRWLMFDML